MFIGRKAIQAKAQLAELKKREFEKANLLGWVDGDPYSAKEIVELGEKHSLLVRDHYFNYAPGGAHWQMTQGHVANLEFAPVLRMVDDAFAEPSILTADQFHDLMKRIGAHMAIAIRDNEESYFEQLATVLRWRSEGKNLADLKPKELNLQLGPGRKQTPLDLSRVFPLALVAVSGRRLLPYALKDEYTRDRIARAEIIKKVSEYGSTISQPELSRWIKKFEFAPFMAEQPIAQKASKKT